MAEGYVRAPYGRVTTVKNDIERNSPFGIDTTPATGLEVKLLTLAMQEIILAEAQARHWRKMSIMSSADGQTIRFKIYKENMVCEGILDVRILRHVTTENIKGVLMDHAKGLLDSIHGRESLSAIEKRRVEHEEFLHNAAKITKL